MPHTPMRLDDVLARDVRVQWFEGVAIVQAVCRHLLEIGRTDGFPPATGITIDARGDVTVRGEPPAGDAVPNAARMLSGMLTADFPVQLRLVMGQAADGTFQTLEEFSNALTYYERPEPAQILRSLYERASQAPRRADAGAPAEEPAPLSLAAPVSAASKGRGERWPLLGAAVVVAAIGGFIWVLEFGSGSAQVDAAIDNVKGTLSKKLGVVSANSTVEQPGDFAPVESEAGQRGRRSSATRTATARPRAQAAPAANAEVPASTLFSPALLWREPLPLIARAPEPDTRFYSTMTVEASTGERGTGTGEPGRIYTRLDPQVIPPRAVYPQLPTAPASGATRDRQTIVDLVIDPTGHVEGVRLRTAPRNIHEFMLLSAAKAWRFDPAVHEDGHPVRFRHSVVITAYP